MTIRIDATVGQLAAEYPATIRVFQRHGIDFCCGGGRRLTEVCEEHELNLEDVQRDLASAAADRPPLDAPAWHLMSLKDITDHIIDQYHRSLDEELPRLGQMMDKVSSVYGQRYPWLAEAAAAFSAIRGTLVPHMTREEQVLFPFLSVLDQPPPTATLFSLPFASIDAPLDGNVAEHETVGAHLATLRRLTADYTPPTDACNTFRGLLHGLAELERDLHEHVHIENNILFSRARRVAADVAQKDQALREWSTERTATLKRIRADEPERTTSAPTPRAEAKRE